MSTNAKFVGRKNGNESRIVVIQNLKFIVNNEQHHHHADYSQTPYCNHLICLNERDRMENILIYFRM